LAYTGAVSEMIAVVETEEFLADVKQKASILAVRVGFELLTGIWIV